MSASESTSSARSGSRSRVFQALQRAAQGESSPASSGIAPTAPELQPVAAAPMPVDLPKKAPPPLPQVAPASPPKVAPISLPSLRIDPGVAPISASNPIGLSGAYESFQYAPAPLPLVLPTTPSAPLSPASPAKPVVDPAVNQVAPAPKANLPAPKSPVAKPAAAPRQDLPRPMVRFSTRALGKIALRMDQPSTQPADPIANTSPSTSPGAPLEADPWGVWVAGSGLVESLPTKRATPIPMVVASPEIALPVAGTDDKPAAPSRPAPSREAAKAIDSGDARLLSSIAAKSTKPAAAPANRRIDLDEDVILLPEDPPAAKITRPQAPIAKAVPPVRPVAPAKTPAPAAALPPAVSAPAKAAPVQAVVPPEKKAAPQPSAAASPVALKVELISAAASSIRIPSQAAKPVSPVPVGDLLARHAASEIQPASAGTLKNPPLLAAAVAPSQPIAVSSAPMVPVIPGRAPAEAKAAVPVKVVELAPAPVVPAVVPAKLPSIEVKPIEVKPIESKPIESKPIVHEVAVPKAATPVVAAPLIAAPAIAAPVISAPVIPTATVAIPALPVKPSVAPPPVAKAEGPQKPAIVLPTFAPSLPPPFASPVVVAEPAPAIPAAPPTSKQPVVSPPLPAVAKQEVAPSPAKIEAAPSIPQPVAPTAKPLLDVRFGDIVSRPSQRPTPWETQAQEELNDEHLGAELRALSDRLERELCESAHPLVAIADIEGRSDAAQLVGWLGMLLARHQGERVLLIDADSQNRGVSCAFQLDRAGGLSEVLAGKLPLREAVVATATDRLQVLPIGNGRSDDLLRDGLADLLQGAREQFTWVLVAGGAAHADLLLPFARLADATVLAVRLGETSVETATAALDGLRLQGARVLGCIVTSGVDE